MRTVILLDKDQEVANRVKAALQPEGFQVFWAGSIAEAQVLLSTRRVDLVIGELPVPPYGYMEDGMASLGHLRKEANGAPILLLTSWLGLDEAIATTAGLAGVVRKSFDDGELVAVVRGQLTQPALFRANETERMRPERKIEIGAGDLPAIHETFVA